MRAIFDTNTQLMLVAVVVLTLTTTGRAWASEQFPAPDHASKCPVCGMLVHRYPDFLASVTFRDGQSVFFDGVKDLFKYYFNLAHYAPDRQTDHIETIRVTEYYDMVYIDGRKAFFVVGSDVFGPMGHELIPFRSEADARMFMDDHKGQRVLTFSQVTPATVKALD